MAAWAQNQHYSSVMASYEEILPENGIKKGLGNGLGINTGAIIEGAEIGWVGRGIVEEEVHTHTQKNQGDCNDASPTRRSCFLMLNQLLVKHLLFKISSWDENADLACVTETC